MRRSAAEILEEARLLPANEVNWLIESLLLDGESETKETIETAWESEIKRRLDEIDSGSVELIPGERVRDEMIASLSPQAQSRLHA
ncbi:MAG: addiction module protein [Terracidiphilus sp.]